jgi:hypothetical protein
VDRGTARTIFVSSREQICVFDCRRLLGATRTPLRDAFLSGNSLRALSAVADAIADRR